MIRSTLDRLSPDVGRVSIMYRSTCRPSGNRHVDRGSIEVSIATIDRHSDAGVISTHDPFFVDRNQTWKPGRKPGLENVIEWDWRNPDTTGCEILCDRKRMYLSSKPWLPTLTMPARRVNRTFTLVNMLLSWAVFTRVSVGVYTRKIFT